MKVRYGASLTVPHPSVPYANVKPTLEAELDCEPEQREQALAELKQFVHVSLDIAVKELQALVER